MEWIFLTRDFKGQRRSFRFDLHGRIVARTHTYTHIYDLSLALSLPLSLLFSVSLDQKKKKHR